MGFTETALRDGLERQGLDVVTAGVDDVAGVAFATVAVSGVDERFETPPGLDLQEACAALTRQVDVAQEKASESLPEGD